MLTIRMQRTGRKGLAQFRVVVQDSQFSPSSGRVVAQLGHYDPHSKESVIDTEKAQKYLQNGAQPSPRVVRLLQDKKVTLPDWVVTDAAKTKRSTRNPEKLRKNQPKEEAAAEEVSAEPAKLATEVATAEEAQAPKVEDDKPTPEEINASDEPATEETGESEEPAASEEKPTEA